MGIIGTGELSKSLMPGVRDWVGHMYNRLPPEYTEIYEVLRSNRNFEEDVNINGIGMASVVPEGTDVSYGDASQGPTQRYVHLDYGRGFIITRNAINDNLYPEVARSFSESLGVGLKATIETVAANVLNRANNSNYTGYDGVELSSALHLYTKGGTYSNELSAATPLSEVGLEQACIDIGGFKDDAGIPMSAMAMKAILPRQLEFEIQRILKSELKNDTAENAINVLRSGRYLPQGYSINHYLTSASKWFIMTNVPKGLRHYLREDLNISNDTVFDSDNMKFKIHWRGSFSWTDPRGIFCNGE